MDGEKSTAEEGEGGGREGGGGGGEPPSLALDRSAVSSSAAVCL